MAHLNSFPIPLTLDERTLLDKQIAEDLPGWVYYPGCAIQAGLLGKGPYTVSIRYDLDNDVSIDDFGYYVRPRLNCSYRPPGHHAHVGAYKSAADLKAGVDAHAAELRERLAIEHPQR